MFFYLCFFLFFLSIFLLFLFENECLCFCWSLEVIRLDIWPQRFGHAARAPDVVIPVDPKAHRALFSSCHELTKLDAVCHPHHRIIPTTGHFLHPLLISLVSYPPTSFNLSFHRQFMAVLFDWFFEILYKILPLFSWNRWAIFQIHSKILPSCFRSSISPTTFFTILIHFLKIISGFFKILQDHGFWNVLECT